MGEGWKFVAWLSLWGIGVFLASELCFIQTDIRAQTAAIVKLDADVSGIAWQNGWVKNQGALGTKGNLVP